MLEMKRKENKTNSLGGGFTKLNPTKLKVIYKDLMLQ